MFYGEIEGGGFEVFEPEFAQTFVGHARLERLYTGCRWAEGPAWFGGGRHRLWADLPHRTRWPSGDAGGPIHGQAPQFP